MDTPDFKTRPNAVQESVASSVVKTAIDLDADLLMVLSHTGATGRLVGESRACFEGQQRERQRARARGRERTRIQRLAS